MSESTHRGDSVERLVRERLAAGDRQRRGREATHQAWRAAPVCALAGLTVTVATRWIGWPAPLPLVVMLIGTCALVLFVYVRRRDVPVSDVAATTIDNDARMRGELRSANWFATRDTRDGWAEFHLVKAAERLEGIDWTHVYPAVPMRRAQVATGVMAATTIVLALTLPERLGVRPTVSASGANVETAAPSQTPADGLVLDPELQRQLEELLAAAASGNLPTAEAIAGDKELRDMLNRLRQLSDAELLEAIKRALASKPNAEAQATLAAENLKRLAEQAKRAADVGTLPKELKEALEKLSDEIELAKGQDATTTEDGDAAAGASDDQMGEGNEATGAEQLSIQFAKAAEAGGGSGVMMMSSPDSAQPGGPPGSGVGGGGSDEMAASAAMIEAALKKETVEASQDTQGKNVDTEIRRKTEHGTATVTFTGSASAQFDRTRAAAPPPVPEARRTGVQTYFVRKPQ